VVERTLSWLNRFRRLKVRYERRADIHQAFLSLGCALICWRAVATKQKRGSALRREAPRDQHRRMRYPILVPWPIGIARRRGVSQWG
jgi:hypothetical protein